MTDFALTPKQAELFDILRGSAMNVLAYGGSRSGKTFAFCTAIVTRALSAPGSRHAIFRQKASHVKQSVFSDTLPKALKLVFPQVPFERNKQDAMISIQHANGEVSEIWCAGLDDKERAERVLGNEYATVYLNEASQISYDSVELVESRLAQTVKRVNGTDLSLKLYVDLNPTGAGHWTYRRWVEGVDPSDKRARRDMDAHAVIQMNPEDNRINLPPAMFDRLQNLSSRKRQRFLLGEYTKEVDGALWRREWIGRLMPNEIDNHGNPTGLERIVIGVDPAASTKPGSDETGIIVVAKREDGSAVVLEDASGVYTPEEWSRLVSSLYRQYGADRIVAEVNNGGDMVASVIQAHGTVDMPVRKVHATRGKHMRAEPISALYERGRVKHVEGLDELEEQMLAFTVDFDRKAQGYSPDRVDALVWALTELFPSLVAKEADPDLFEETLAPSWGQVEHGWMGL